MSDAQVEFDKSVTIAIFKITEKFTELDARLTALEEDVAGLLEDSGENEDDGDDGSRDAYE